MSRHLKRLAAPQTYKIERKTHKWTVKVTPGPHPQSESIPLLVAIRDMLHLCDSAKEARMIIGARAILVDGTVDANYKRPLGLMDVISIPKLKENYRVLLDTHGRLNLVKISDVESKWKLARIENKTTVKNGKIQLNLHDGRNILLDKNKYKTCDVLKIEVPSQKILTVYSMEKGNVALLIGGAHIGRIASITGYTVTHSPKPNIVSFDKFRTIRNHVFVIGQTVPEIKLPEVSAI